MELPFDIFKRPIILADPCPESCEALATFKDYVLKYCVRTEIPTFVLMGTCVCPPYGMVNYTDLLRREPTGQVILAGTVTNNQWWMQPHELDPV